jgi:hypothetical protein
MKTYSVQGVSASGTSNKSAANVIGSTAIRPRLRQAVVAAASDPNSTDQKIQYQIGNTTAVGTAGSSPTPKPDDPQDVAAVCTAGITHSAEPTYGSTYFVDSYINQRGVKEWRWDDGFQPCGAASASNGIGARLAAVTSALALGMMINFAE